MPSKIDSLNEIIEKIDSLNLEKILYKIGLKANEIDLKDANVTDFPMEINRFLKLKVRFEIIKSLHWTIYTISDYIFKFGIKDFNEEFIKSSQGFYEFLKSEEYLNLDDETNIYNYVSKEYVKVAYKMMLIQLLEFPYMKNCIMAQLYSLTLDITHQDNYVKGDVYYEPYEKI